MAEGYNFFYQPTPYALEPKYGEFIGYRVPAGRFGLTTDPRTANIIQEVTTKLNPGGKSIEITGISPEIFEAIPNQHLEEVNKLSKLTGVTPTLHGPLIDASGFTREGWTEGGREIAESQISSAIERGHKLNPQGNIPITLHSSSMWAEGEEKIKVKEEGKMVEKVVSATVIDPDSGSVGRIPIKERFFPGEEKIPTTEKEIKELNERVWNDRKTHFAFNANRASTLIDAGEEFIQYYVEAKKRGTLDKIEVDPGLREKYENAKYGEIFLHEAYRELKDMYNRAYKYGTEENKEILRKFGEEVKAKAEAMQKDPIGIVKLKEMANIVKAGINVIENLKTPEIYAKVDDFALSKAAQTFGNVAFKSYKKFGSTAPIISIENPPAGAGFSRAEQIKQLIEESRKKFVEVAKKEGYSEGDATRAAEKLIGATWDVGHINMIRKYGYDKADILKETEIVRPYLKHIHLSDNFGFEHTELPMGMGNVPIKEIMEKLGKEGFEAKKVIEAGNWWQHFKTPPMKETLEAFGSGMYSAYAPPFWNQAVGLSQNYYAGFGTYLPEQHFAMYGGGFSNLPSELGGQIPGKQARMGGAPIE